MEQKLMVELSPQKFGEAICFYLGLRTGNNFFPYRIVKSSYVPPETIGLESTNEPIVALPQVQRQKIALSRVHFTITREELKEALSYSVLLSHYQNKEAARAMQPNCEFPDKIEVEVVYVPRESTNQQTQNSYGGL